MNPFLNYLYKKLIQPKSKDEDLRRREFLLNIIALATIGLLLWSELYLIRSRIIDGSSSKGVSILLFSFVLFIFLCIYFFSKRGYIIVSSYILISIYGMSIFYASYHWGVNLPTALLSYGLLIVISSILISVSFSFVVTSVISLFLITLGFLNYNDIIKPADYWLAKKTYISDTIEYSIILFFITTVSWLSNRETERSLGRARRSEKALRIEKDLLELKVGTRTNELRQLQMRRVTELHHLAEMGKSAGGFFHDLMNPLTGLVLSVERFNSRSAGSKRLLSEQLDKSLSASRQMEKFISAIRKHSSIAPVDKTLPAKEELDQAIQLLGYKARKNGVSLELAVHGETEFVAAPADFYKIAYNLISYGIDATSGSAANISKAVAIKLSFRPAGIALEVSYPGSVAPSMDPEEPADAETLGLTIAKSLLEKTRGSLSIRLGSGKTKVVLEACFPQS